MRETNATQMLRTMRQGRVYHRSSFVGKWSDIDRDLKTLLEENKLEKVGPGLYYKPRRSPFGLIPPDEKEVIRRFLKGDSFLLINESWYASLGVGLTQLSARSKVLNRKRHGLIELNGRIYDFRLVREFPRKLSKEFLLVDLMNNVQVAEDGKPVNDHVLRKLEEFDLDLLLKSARKYGKVRTRKFFEQVILNEG